jgi:serine/threonine protein kinase
LLEPGQTFAHRYRILRRIAEGGMGAIFEAEHTGTERRVALKLLFPHIMSVASARQKFELEAKVSARVNSPYIVSVLDAGFDEATRSPYLVMELLSGHTLATYVKEKGALDVDEALRLLQQVAAGLDAAHGYKESSGAAKPIVHRDLKPENLFITREHEGPPQVKILDFGIAKVLGDTANVSQEVRGTPLYMAFEQVTAGPLSPATDVWSLGLIAYYVLTGHRYWRSADQQGSGVQSLFAEILTLPIEAPSLRSKQQATGVELPAAFDAWLLRCLDRDPSRRFRSAGLAVEEFARAFNRTPRTRSRPAPKLPATRGLSATQTFDALPARGHQPTTAASLPAVASERGSVARSVRGKPRSWIAGAAVGFLLVAVLGWFLRDPSPAGSTLPAAGVVPGPEQKPTSAEVPASDPPRRMRPPEGPRVGLAPVQPEAQEAVGANGAVRSDEGEPTSARAEPASADAPPVRVVSQPEDTKVLDDPGPLGDPKGLERSIEKPAAPAVAAAPLASARPTPVVPPRASVPVPSPSKPAPVSTPAAAPAPKPPVSAQSVKTAEPPLEKAPAKPTKTRSSAYNTR